MKKKIALLGSTGSIGKTTLDVVRHLNGDVEVVSLAAMGSRLDLLEEQIKQFSPRFTAVYDKEAALALGKRCSKAKVEGGMEAIVQAATLPEVELVVLAISGAAGLLPTVKAIDAGKDIALACKEVLVAAGELVMDLVKARGVQLLPVDSEHSALFQCLQGEETKKVDRLILTASGGPFHSFSSEALDTVTVEEALGHPTWDMGAKITVDCSTLMNKGLEVIEAVWLFDLQPEKIEVVVHPQSIVHSFVEFIDGSIKAQLSEPTMAVPIQYALTYPHRRQGTLARFDFIRNGMLKFQLPDKVKFPCLELAYQAITAGGSAPCFLNAANEVLVERFLQRKIGWKDIGRKLTELLSDHSAVPMKSLDDIFQVDRAAREKAKVI